MKSASRAQFAVAWLLLVADLGVVALNPGVPSLSYALLWLGVVAVARGISMLISWVAVTVDLSLLLLCLFGMEIGGLILMPSIPAFTAADAMRPERVTARQSKPRRGTTPHGFRAAQ
jgi:hypothetical protein